MAWLEFAVAFAVFFLSHSLPVRPPLRPWLDDRLGRRGFAIAYSMLSLAVLAWLIATAGRAPHVPLWAWAPWQNWVVLGAMASACLILAVSLGRPNPLSFGGAADAAFDPARPGLLRWVRHPILLALALWSVAHLLANGDLAHVLLFGTFAVFAVAGRKLVDRRKRRDLGARWEAITAAARSGPVSLRDAMGGRSAALRLTAAALGFLGLLWLHPLLIGARPLP
ncbi:NnrU family protein [Roseibacterium beibuensis]|uniref:NnrU family protein n=1 Tax=[Roseibacterium] beibuensis TaxID=1193142 RepID=A0ABP9LH30_9RHOB|nr:NnrU family protein [Roseibacterium beibuensis]MCS6623332.1 NnrU family protein [Roseibacterium beibuensis]